MSDSIHQANSVLYGGDSDLELDISVFESSLSSNMSESGDKANGEGGSTSSSPTNLDTVKHLKRIESKMAVMDNELNELDSLEQKFSNFESELKKLWTFVHGQFKDNKDAMLKVSERIDTWHCPRSDYAVDI